MASRKAVVSWGVPAVTRRWCGMPDVAHEDALFEQGRPSGVRVGEATEQDEVGVARDRPVAQGGQLGDDAVALRP